MIGTGCGITTDHFARSGVTGNGARPKCGMPASLATLETAIVDGVVDDPMMMSALDSVTKRRALVVAVVGSPPSSRTMTLSGTPAISFGTKSRALRSGTPSAAAGPVVVIEMPMVISLVWAAAGTAGSANATAAATRSILFMNFLPLNLVILALGSHRSSYPLVNFSAISSGIGADFRRAGSSG